MKAGKGIWPTGLKIILGLFVLIIGLIFMLEYLGGEQEMQIIEAEIPVPPMPVHSSTGPSTAMGW